MLSCHAYMNKTTNESKIRFAQNQSCPNDYGGAKIEAKRAQVFVERRLSWRTNGEMGSRVRSANKTQKCNDP